MPNFMRAGVKHSAYQVPVEDETAETAVMPPVWVRDLIARNRLLPLSLGGFQTEQGANIMPGDWLVRVDGGGFLIFTDATFNLEFTPEE